MTSGGISSVPQLSRVRSVPAKRRKPISSTSGIGVKRRTEVWVEENKEKKNSNKGPATSLLSGVVRRKGRQIGHEKPVQKKRKFHIEASAIGTSEGSNRQGHKKKNLKAWQKRTKKERSSWGTTKKTKSAGRGKG